MNAVASGGPMDGEILGPATAAQFEVVMADRSRWRYTQTGQRQLLSDGTTAIVYECAGRI